MTQTTLQVLLVDDDLKLSRLVAEYLRPEGFGVTAAHDGETGVEQALSGDYRIVVLDVMLPGINGFEALRRIRLQSRIPVLMLTARGLDDDRIRGLEVGADDYLAKPFNPRELLARINAILRRSDSSPSDTRERISVGDLEVDMGARTVRCGSAVIELTSVEFDLLETLVRAAGRVVRREELTRKVLDRELSPFDRSIDMHVSKLRRKLKECEQEANRIKTVRRVGYIYANASEPTT